MNPDNGNLPEKKFNRAMNQWDTDNNIDIETENVMQWLLKNEDMICKPYKGAAMKLLEMRDEEQKEIKQAVRNYGGADVMTDYCQVMYEDLGELSVRKPKFKKKEFKHLKPSQCWNAVKDLHS